MQYHIHAYIWRYIHTYIMQPDVFNGVCVQCMCTYIHMYYVTEHTFRELQSFHASENLFSTVRSALIYCAVVHIVATGVACIVVIMHTHLFTRAHMNVCT